MKLFVFLATLLGILYLLHVTVKRAHGGKRQSPPSSASSMEREEALAILGLEADATQEDVIDAHRKLMQRVHPDKGGSAKLAQQLNEAKRALLIR